jgi:predicted permease
LRRFGNLDEAKREITRDARRRQRLGHYAVAVDGLRHDVRHALRWMRRSPGVAGLGLVILTSSIALAAATFAVTDNVLFRPLPYPEPKELVTLQSVGESGVPFNSASMTNWVDWKERNASLAATALWQPRRVTVSGDGFEPFRVDGIVEHGDLLRTLGVRFLLGRSLTEAEVQSGERGAVVSEALWRRVLGADSQLDRLSLTLDGTRHPVVGVLARGQEFPDRAQLWIAAPHTRGSGGMRNNISYEAVARLRPGTSIAEARADLGGIARGIRESEPEALYSYGVGVQPLHERVAGEARRSLRSLMSAALFVLAIACANLAGLGLVRAKRSRGELAVRLALGAGRWRLVRQVFVEQAIVSASAALAGLALAWLASTSLLPLLSRQLPRSADLAVDARVFLFGGVTAAACALLIGIGPALGILRGSVDPGANVARGGIRGGRGLPGAALVAVEVALATALLIGGGLLIRSFLAAASRPLGYDPDNVVTLDITLTSSRYRDADAAVSYWTELIDRMGRRPDVVAAAVGNWIPTGGGGTSFVELEDGAQGDLGAGYRVVSDLYFQVMRMPIQRGRTFTSADQAGTERVGLVTQGLAHRYWPGENPLGKRIKATSMEAYYFGGQAPWITVIGVVGDVRHHGFESDPRPELFVLYRQVPDWTSAMTAVVRTLPGAGTRVEGLQALARGVDTSLAVESNTLTTRVRALLEERRVVLGVLWTFAVLAVVLSSLGIYALMTFAAQERRRELAIRAALGATRMGVVELMILDASRVLAVGLMGGVAAGYALTRVLAALLLDVSSTDPLTYAVAAALLAFVALGAALIPSWRAARADPLTTLNT